MKKTVSLSLLIERIQKFGPALGGVFSYGDLFNLIGVGSDQQNKRTIKRLVRDGILTKILRGFYTTRNPDLWVLGCRLKKGAYVSMDSILSKNLLIGTIPARSVSLVYNGLRRKTLETPFGLVRYFSIKKNLLFGISRLPNGVRNADSEKAYLDLLYYYTKGARFVVDPLAEIDLTRLNRRRLNLYLKKYANPKFISFVKGQFDGVN